MCSSDLWLNKAVQGRAHDIRYCVSCNNCWGHTTIGNTMRCDNNPRVGLPDEVDWWPARAVRTRRVVVVGAGVAGLEAAWVAAARGHEVTVLGRSREAGGKARLRASLPDGEAISSVYDYQHAAALRAGARIELGVEADAATVLALRPDAVVLATGANMVPPRWLPAEVRESGLVPDLRRGMEELLRVKGRQPGTAVVFDQDHTDGTYAAAEVLHARFDRAVIITPRQGVAEDAAMVTRQGILRRMNHKRIQLVTLAEPEWTDAFESGVLEYANVYTGERGSIRDVAFFAYSTPRAADVSLVAPLRAAGVEVHLIGDAVSARNVMAATAEGHAIGNEL